MNRGPTEQGPTEQRPQRTCVACRRTREQHDLLRFAATPDGVRVDPQRRLPGRGAYICADTACHDLVVQRDGQPLQRALRGAPRDEIIAAITSARQHLADPAHADEAHDDGAEQTPRRPGGRPGREREE